MNALPLSQTLAAVEQAVPRELVSDRALDRARAFARRLPAALSSTIYLECRLAAETSRVDVILGVDRDGRDILAGKNPAIFVPEAVSRNQVWSHLGQLCRQWCEPRSEMHRGVVRLWLEFDLDGREKLGEIPIPGIFVDFALQDRQGSRHDSRGLALAVLDSLFQGARATWHEQWVQRCFELLPDGCWVPYVGVFPARQGDSIRFCVRGLDPQQRLEYLRAVGWAGADQLGSSIAALTEHWGGDEHKQGAVLHLDVGLAGVGPALGLEYYLERPPQLRGELSEIGFLDHLGSLGLCSANKRQGLLAWPGCEIRRLSHQLWPSLVSRRVNHIKLVHDHHRFVEAKGYLCVSHRYYQRPQSTLQQSTGSGEAEQRS